MKINAMIVRHDDGWTVFYDGTGDREIARVKFPEGGCTMAELELFIDHLKREAKLREVGPS